MKNSNRIAKRQIVTVFVMNNDMCSICFHRVGKFLDESLTIGKTVPFHFWLNVFEKFGCNLLFWTLIVVIAEPTKATRSYKSFNAKRKSFGNSGLSQPAYGTIASTVLLRQFSTPIPPNVFSTWTALSRTNNSWVKIFQFPSWMYFVITKIKFTFFPIKFCRDFWRDREKARHKNLPCLVTSEALWAWYSAKSLNTFWTFGSIVAAKSLLGTQPLRINAVKIWRKKRSKTPSQWQGKIYEFVECNNLPISATVTTAIRVATTSGLNSNRKHLKTCSATVPGSGVPWNKLENIYMLRHWRFSIVS